MLALTPCHFLSRAVSLNLLLNSHSPLLPRSYFFKSSLVQKLIPEPTMSCHPSVFDTLMSNARAAATKKKPQARAKTQPSSPKKRGTQIDGDSSSEPKLGIDDPISSSKEPALSADELEQAAVDKSKKQRTQDSAPEMKTEVPLLKMKVADFDPKTILCLEKGESVPFMFLSLGLNLISNESGRIVITDIVTNVLRTIIDAMPDDLVATVYLLAGKIAPPHEGLELGIGDALIVKALSEAFGRSEKDVRTQSQEMGDLGLVAKASRSSQSLMRKPDVLTIAKVFSTFRLIAKESGKDSQIKKKNHIKALLVAGIDCEPLYIVRMLQGSLRIGSSGKTLLVALAQAALYANKQFSPPPHIQSPLKEAIKIVKQVYSILPIYERIIPALLSDGVWNLSKTCSFTPGVPVSPMLAKQTNNVSEIINKFQDMEFTCEYKYDGERAQMHYLENGSVEIYSRNAERNTGKFPDVVVAISRLKKPSVKSFIVDGEIVAFDREKKKILPFQILSTRARKNVVMSDIKVDVCIFAFDILYLNGQALIQEQLALRRERLRGAFEEEAGYFQFATAIVSNDVEEIQKFLDAAVDASCEGLIIKTLNRDATYEPSERSNNWLKLKKDYMEGMGDSLDLVPIAAFHGRGKRTGVYGTFLLACYDDQREEYQSICRTGTGFSEALLEDLSASLRANVIEKPKPYYRFGETINPDVWFEPSEVWEVRAADLTKSPVHRAAIGEVDRDKGISLRFPRLIRVRADKSPEQASTSEQIAEMYRAQSHNQPNNEARNNSVEEEEEEA